MPKVSNFHITPEQEELFQRSCVFKSQSYGDKVDSKFTIFRKRNFESLIKQSSFPDVAVAWNTLTDYQKSRWSDAGYYSQQSGWDLFAQDTAYRIANGIQGIGEPNLYHQFKVGHIHVGAPATSIAIKQDVNLAQVPAYDFAINYFANLTATGAGAYAFLFLNFYIFIDGEWGWWEEDLSFYNSDRWEYTDDYYDFSLYPITQMYISIEIYNMQGDLYIDGLSLISCDINYAKDWQCDNIGLTWSSISVPSGAYYESVYSRNVFYNYYP